MSHHRRTRNVVLPQHVDEMARRHDRTEYPKQHRNLPW
jgi:hypothetical protein